ncbi:MAG: arginine repressor [Deltaproteobacteria bacterium]|nr:MAG: arginine repressor [Deltaproteobacteria bacterium]
MNAAPRSTPVPTAKTRRFVLRKILQSGHASTQQELVEMLAERGIKATQSTVSRDLKLLGARRRIDERGAFVYVLESDRRASFPADMVVTVQHNECMVVVRTKVGRAQPVALDLDALKLPDLLGTVAGDDTVLAIPKSVRRTAELARRIRELAGLA